MQTTKVKSHIFFELILSCISYSIKSFITKHCIPIFKHYKIYKWVL